MKRKWIYAGLIIILAFVDAFTSCRRLKPIVEENDSYIKNETYSGDLTTLESGNVIKVIDGDTFICDINNKQTTIRLIGVDAPESVNADEEKNSPEGREVSKYMDWLLSDQTVYLEYDVSTSDRYGRTLAYVYLSDGRMVEDILLEEGYARLMTIQPNSKYAEHFKMIESKAKKNEKGYWQGLFNEDS